MDRDLPYLKKMKIIQASSYSLPDMLRYIWVTANGTRVIQSMSILIKERGNRERNTTHKLTFIYVNTIKENIQSKLQKFALLKPRNSFM